MNKESDYNIKIGRIRKYISSEKYDAFLLGLRENFAWLTCGGNNKIFWDHNTGFGLLLITAENVYLIAQSMDADRIYDDELEGLDIEKISVKWFEEVREHKAMQLVKGQRVVSDIPVIGADYKPLDIIQLHYPLLDSEVQKYKEYGRQYESILWEIANEIKPGMTEKQIETVMATRYISAGFRFKTLLIGSDERITKYRHPNPSNKKVKKLVLLHPGVCKDGMNIYATRMIWLGSDVDTQFEEKYELLNYLEAQAASMCRSGVGMWEIIEERKKVLVQHGLEHEIENHYPGSLIGYASGTAQPVIDNWEIKKNMAFGWYITLTGAKVEETVLSGERGEFVTTQGIWPTKPYQYGEYRCELPVLLRA